MSYISDNPFKLQPSLDQGVCPSAVAARLPLLKHAPFPEPILHVRSPGYREENCIIPLMHYPLHL